MAWSDRQPANDDDSPPARVGLVFATDSEPWEQHLSCALQVGDSCQLQVNSCSLQQLERDINANVMPDIADADLQVVILSPAFLSLAAAMELRLDGVLDMNRTLALLLGVTEQQVNNSQIEGLRSFPMWKKHALKDKDKDCVADFVSLVQSMLDQEASSDNGEDPVFDEKFTIATGDSVDDGFLVLYILLNAPVDPEKDQLSVWLRGYTDNTPYYRLFSANMKNPHTAFIYLPIQNYPDLASVELVCGGSSWGVQPVKHPWRVESLGNFLDTLTSPIDFMCQNIGVDPCTAEELDTFLARTFKGNCPPGISQLDLASDLPGMETRETRYPTLLHLAAAHGLSQLCSRLVDAPGGERALIMNNAAGQLPTELAAAAGHQLLAEQLQQAAELSSLSKLVPRINQSWSNVNDDEVRRSLEEWMRPNIVQRQESQEQSKCESPQYAGIHDIQRVVWNTEDSGPDFTCDILASGPYLKMHKEEQAYPPESAPQRTRYRSRDQSAGSPTDDSSTAAQRAGGGASTESARCQANTARVRVVKPIGLPAAAYKPATRRPLLLNTMDDQLRDLLNDYKNNEYTLSELETVVHSWATRNDFQQYLRDNNPQKSGVKPQANGIFSRFFAPAVKVTGRRRKTCYQETSETRIPHSTCTNKPTGRSSVQRSPKFKSYATPLDKEMRGAVALAKFGTTLALATTQAPPQFPTSPFAPPEEGMYVSLQPPVPSRKAATVTDATAAGGSPATTHRSRSSSSGTLSSSSGPMSQSSGPPTPSSEPLIPSGDGVRPTLATLAGASWPRRRRRAAAPPASLQMSPTLTPTEAPHTLTQPPNWLILRTHALTPPPHPLTPPPNMPTPPPIPPRRGRPGPTSPASSQS